MLRANNLKKEHLMRKKLKKRVGITVLVTAIMLSAPVESSFAAPPTYLSNIYDEVMISRIVPAEQYLEVTYNKLGIRADGEIPEYFNIQFGGLTDAELYSMGTGQGANIKLVGATREQLFGGVPVSGQIGVINESIIGRFGPKLINNTSGRLDYIIVYDGGGGNQLSRADYSRCVNSSVFISGEATECRMERIGVNKVQYQPYTAEGIRVEIPADEDAILTAMTDNWRPETGEWGPEWQDESDDGDGDGDDDKGSDSGKSGDDEKSDVNGDGSGSNDGGYNDSDYSEGENNDDSEGDKDGEKPKTDEIASGESSKSANNAENRSEEKDDAVSETSDNRGEVVVASENGGGDNGIVAVSENGGGNNGNVIDGKMEEQFSDNNENSGEDYVAVTNEEFNADQDVGVPNLGKEPDNQPNWIAIMTICLASVAGLVGWVFLFFGKSKRNKRKETKE